MCKGRRLPSRRHKDHEGCAQLLCCRCAYVLTQAIVGYNLPSKCILHAAGPVYTASNAALAEEQLMCCYISTLRLAAEHKLRTVALCAVSTGIYGYPLKEATHIAFQAVRDFLDVHGDYVSLPRH